jgi:hypothetical protein
MDEQEDALLTSIVTEANIVEQRIKTESKCTPERPPCAKEVETNDVHALIFLRYRPDGVLGRD